jgi:hypothetical protein
MSGQCASCHGGSYTAVNAKAKPGTHIPTTTSCDSCHSNFLAFAPATMSHTGLNGQCATCHNGSYLAQNAQAKSANHQVTAAQCDGCHFSTTTWATVTQNHAVLSPPATGRCSDCHKTGGSGLPKPGTHIPTALQCDTCHKNYTTFAPAAMSHTGSAGLCANCHGGAYTAVNAQKKGATHIPTSLSCDSCHTSTVNWTSRTMNHAGLNGQCLTCHNGAYVSENAQAKSPGHLPTTAQCDACHLSTVVWTGTKHIATATGQCQTCHISTYTGFGLEPKPANHIPTTLSANWALCDTCHKTGYYTTWGGANLHKAPASQPLALFRNQCKLCHYDGNPWGITGPNKKTPHTATKPKTGGGTLSCDASGSCHNRPVSTSTWNNTP